MFRKIFFSMAIFLLILPVLYAHASVFDKNVIADVVTWDNSDSIIPEKEMNRINYFTGDDNLVLGKVIKIEPVFPQRNEMPHGLVNLHVYEGDNQGKQIKFLTSNLLFICASDTPYPHCHENIRNMGSLISIENDDQPWILPGDTVILVLRSYRIQVAQTEGDTKILMHARFINGEYDKGQDQTTYRQKAEPFTKIFQQNEYEKHANCTMSKAYEFLHLTRVKEGKVSQTLDQLNAAIK